MASDQQNAPFFVDTEVITLNRNGIWLSDGVEIDHEPTRRAFARSLKRDGQGYFLQIGRETKRITVEDTPYFVHRVDGTPETGIELWLNDESREALDPSTLSYRPGRLACRIKGRAEEAKFLHSAYFDLLRHLQEDGAEYYIEFADAGRVVLALKA